MYEIIENGRKAKCVKVLKKINTIDEFDDWCSISGYSQEEVGNGEDNKTMFIARTRDENRVVASFLYLGEGKVSCLEYRTPVASVEFTQEEVTEKNIAIVNDSSPLFPPVQKGLFSQSKKERTMIYFSCPTGKRRDEIVAEFGDSDYAFGACLTPTLFNNITASKMEWFLDNGAYQAFSKNVPFSKNKFYERLVDVYTKVRCGEIKAPDFVVIPDIVGGGMGSLHYSSIWMKYLETTKVNEFNYYLAIQDGMSIEAVEAVIRDRKIDGLFLGGTKVWKYATGKKWSELATKYNLLIHVGGVGVKSKIEWAEKCCFTSVDSGVAMIHPKHLNEVLDMVREEMMDDGYELAVS